MKYFVGRPYEMFCWQALKDSAAKDAERLVEEERQQLRDSQERQKVLDSDNQILKEHLEKLQQEVQQMRSQLVRILAKLFLAADLNDYLFK